MSRDQHISDRQRTVCLISSCLRELIYADNNNNKNQSCMVVRSVSIIQKDTKIINALYYGWSNIPQKQNQGFLFNTIHSTIKAEVSNINFMISEGNTELQPIKTEQPQGSPKLQINRLFRFNLLITSIVLLKKERKRKNIQLCCYVVE